MSFSVKTGLLDRVDGSAELLVGPIKVVSSVTGPIEPKPRQELPNLASLEIVVRPAVGVSTTREKLLEDKLRLVLQSVIVRFKYPRQLVQIVVQFLATDSAKDYTANELSAALNCCYFALVDANIALENSFASVALAVGAQTVVGPSSAQLAASESHHVVCFDIKEARAGKLLLLESAGKFTEEQLFEVVETGSRECQQLHGLQRSFIAAKVNDDFVWKL